jgi:hypothetical protein
LPQKVPDLKLNRNQNLNQELTGGGGLDGEKK